MESVTVAGIDCGTNSIRLKVSRVSEDGVEDIVPRILRQIRLGQDVDKTHRFADEALERAYAAAREFAEGAEEHPVDGIRFVATSATRDAENREEFEDTIEQILGVRPEVIPGTEEADLSFLGATSVVRRDVEAPYLVVDLGGGSTELVLGGDGVSHPNTGAGVTVGMNPFNLSNTLSNTRKEACGFLLIMSCYLSSCWLLIPLFECRFSSWKSFLMLDFTFWNCFLVLPNFQVSVRSSGAEAPLPSYSVQSVPRVLLDVELVIGWCEEHQTQVQLILDDGFGEGGVEKCILL